MTTTTAEAKAGGEGYRRYLLAILVLVYALNFLDRQIINILAESIKRDLDISDTQLGLLTGTAFGIFYSLLGLPIARLVEAFPGQIDSVTLGKPTLEDVFIARTGHRFFDDRRAAS